jgi:hypothetical protein
VADDRGLPPDDEACELLGHLLGRGIPVAVWTNGIANDTTCFPCRNEDMQILHDELQQLETQEIIDRDFCLTRTKRLFAQIANAQNKAMHPGRRSAANSDHGILAATG